MIKKNNSKEYTKFGSGIFVVKSVNSNFNADFTGTPRRLPDEEGTIYATDKSLKYCIRKYLKDKGKSVFVWRRKTSDGNPLTLIQNYAYFHMNKEKKIKTIKEYLKNKSKVEVLKNLLTHIDVRLFGVTFAPQGVENLNISLAGPVQISYGINKFPENISYTNQILSPYATEEKEKELTKPQTTIGEESRCLESHYVFDFVVNPNNLREAVEHLEEKDSKDIMVLSEADIDDFKEAICRGVTQLNSTTKIGCEGEFFLYIESSTPLVLQNLKEFVKIKKTSIDLTDLVSYLKSIGKTSVGFAPFNIEIYYDPKKISIDGIDGDFEDKLSKFNINTLSKIDNGGNQNK